MTSNFPTLIFPNSVKMLVQYLKANLPSGTVVSSVIPANRSSNMVIVRLSGGSEGSYWMGTNSFNLMSFSTSWEKAYDLALEVDAVMRVLDLNPGPLPIISMTTTVLPFPSGDGITAETPVYSASYQMTVSAQSIQKSTTF